MGSWCRWSTRASETRERECPRAKVPVRGTGLRDGTAEILALVTDRFGAKRAQAARAPLIFKLSADAGWTWPE